MKLNRSVIKNAVRQALVEDIGNGDVTAALLPDRFIAKAEILSREPMLVCGQPWVEEVFAQVDIDIKLNWLVSEGTWLAQPTILCRIEGNARTILSAERCALNFLQTLSGTATKTRMYLQKLKGKKTRLLDTRKTLPGLRLAQKYAVACAGAVNHRIGLYDAFLIKENHIMACGSIQAAIEKARASRPDLLIEVEVENLEELQQALAANPNRILLDNFTREMLQQAVEMNKTHQCELEASGGINLANLAEFADTGVDFISIGALTKSVEAIDLSLLLLKPKSVDMST
jgi:nicotinate-nucleotide pyrophosphorylase (carboxylating)